MSISAVANGAKVTMMAKKGTLTLKKPSLPSFAKKPAAKKAAPAPKKVASPNRGSAAERQLWLPNTAPPAWLDGSMIGDRGFDPLGLAKPAEYLQFELDALDQNAATNPSGNVMGKLIPDSTTVSEDSLQVRRPIRADPDLRVYRGRARGRDEVDWWASRRCSGELKVVSRMDGR